MPDAGGESGGPRAVPPALGEQLREGRRRRGITVADVERDTRINATYIEALEDEQFELLPAPVYARGFLRSYARYLGLDVEAIAALMPRELPRPGGLEPSAGLRRSPRGGLLTLPALNPPVAAAAFAAALVVLLAVAAYVWFARGDAASQTAPAGATTTTTATATATVTTQGAAATATATPAAAPAVTATVPPFAAGEMPDFVGVSRERAETLLANLELSVPVIIEAPSDAAAGEIIGQTPDPGRAIQAGTMVTLVVSRGPSPASQ